MWIAEYQHAISKMVFLFGLIQDNNSFLISFTALLHRYAAEVSLTQLLKTMDPRVYVPTVEIVSKQQKSIVSSSFQESFSNHYMDESKFEIDTVVCFVLWCANKMIFLAWKASWWITMDVESTERYSWWYANRRWWHVWIICTWSEYQTLLSAVLTEGWSHQTGESYECVCTSWAIQRCLNCVSLYFGPSHGSDCILNWHDPSQHSAKGSKVAWQSMMVRL